MQDFIAQCFKFMFKRMFIVGASHNLEEAIDELSGLEEVRLHLIYLVFHYLFILFDIFLIFYFYFTNIFHHDIQHLIDIYLFELIFFNIIPLAIITFSAIKINMIYKKKLKRKNIDYRYKMGANTFVDFICVFLTPASFLTISLSAFMYYALQGI